MGCDGGTKVDKREFIVKVKKDNKGIDKDVKNTLAWTTCSLSKEPLSEPIVSCALGRLYNKEAIVEALIKRKSTKKSDPTIEHIQGLKELINIHFERNSDANKDASKSSYICPVSKQEIRGQYKFYAIPNCGHVVSDKVIQVSQNKACMVCNEPYDVPLLLNPPEAEEKIIKERIMTTIKTNKKRPRKKENVKSSEGVEPAVKKPKIAEPKEEGKHEVYNSLFIDKTKETGKIRGDNFLCRGGMKGPARVQ
ncbi:hypothetical protein AKO1_014751 [Acrasis kona]|uniref:Replication termination factor 2 n=1 Tax=Acrasis kona TaxID=1008807 RepID=A0AAW2Z3I4_9EUKA